MSDTLCSKTSHKNTKKKKKNFSLPPLSRRAPASPFFDAERCRPSASAPPSARRQPRLLLPPLPVFHQRPPSLLPLLSLPPPSAVAFSSFTAATANPTAFLLRDAAAVSSANFLAAAISLSFFLFAVADDMRVLTALTLVRRRRPRLRLHQPAGPSFPTRRRSHRPRPLPSPLFPSRRRRGRATSAFFPCFLTASSPPSPLRLHPASSAASFCFDAVLCCRHGLEVAVSLYWSLLRVRTRPPSPLPSLPSTLLSRTPVARCLLSPTSPPPPLVSATAAVEKTASTTFAAAFLSYPGIDLFRFWYADFVCFSIGYAHIL